MSVGTDKCGCAIKHIPLHILPLLAMVRTKSGDIVVDHTKRIPPEILAEIFMSTVVAEHMWIHPRHAPWVLGHICKRWRAIALSSPKNWCCLRSLFASGRPVPLISAHIQRSGRLPLTVGLNALHRPPLFALLLGQSHRFEDVTISCAMTQEGVPAHAQGNFGLTALQSAHSDSLLTALRSGDFACVKRLHFSICNLPPLCITLPSLTSLAIHASPVSLVGQLSTPNLEQLLLEYPNGRSSVFEDVRPLLQSASCTLTRLGLKDVKIMDPELISLLEFLPNLAELIFFSDYISTAFLSGLRLEKTMPCVVPKLKCLSLGGRIPVEALFDMIESRCQEQTPCQSLLSVQLCLKPGRFDVETKARLRTWSEGGMDVGAFELNRREWVSIGEVGRPTAPAAERFHLRNWPIFADFLAV
ncbi:hypothetical protein DFH06DRAFT_1161390 [Mycena polygramma]|nr:hypothetical protein DFH06DRAFT_1161390 [Mycena polygramma]